MPSEIEVEIDGLTPDGLGIGRVDGQQLRIRNALPGERVHARILRKRRGLRYADAVGVLTSSVHRVPSTCKHFPRCGGCALHHLDYVQQLELKHNGLARELELQGVEVRRWVPPRAEVRLGYRTKARLGVRLVGEQLLVGFRESFSNRVTRASTCEILSPRFARLLPHLKAVLPTLSVAAAIPQVELAEGEKSAAIIIRHLMPLANEDRRTLRAFADTHDLQVLLQAKGYDTLCCVNEGAVRLLEYSLSEYGLSLEFHPAQFTQVNQVMNRQLVRRVVSYLKPLPGKHIVDLFCGIGNFTLPLARRGAHVRGYELGADTVEMARNNARRNRVAGRVRVDEADLYREPPIWPAALDGLLLDPPRSGAGPLLATWLEGVNARGCRDIVYVSCNPRTFASDARTMVAAGYTLMEVGIHDMFPHTSHVETLGWFVRDKAVGKDMKHSG